MVGDFSWRDFSGYLGYLLPFSLEGFGLSHLRKLTYYMAQSNHVLERIQEWKTNFEKQVDKRERLIG
ncbi:unnamed protein product [Brugia timori]|uniref:Uncharacterized protein n=1 Tax=Brugia timori TaxID=42155 RepID=A0A3P7XUL3_9BILA|nr:unnamed protein product [Brugia timori]